MYFILFYFMFILSSWLRTRADNTRARQSDRQAGKEKKTPSSCLMARRSVLVTLNQPCHVVLEVSIMFRRVAFPAPGQSASQPAPGQKVR
ncbi:hypothetical protein B0T22DRAFT_464598 [Podospora appendiculata]|uniref:Secreted protein n=1 Tax=Podospora appendiculata TaxID=314037 RepID=A0AAE1C9Y6_9PEZI|nr:hypothetical protein B0T22DRAFT_464598 [Podospora appendiculata]